MTIMIRIPESDGAGRLGRHVHHDPRSLDYQVSAEGVAIVPVDWPDRIAVLDQGNLGSCTGNALVGMLGCDPYFVTRPANITLDEPEAVLLYSAATKIDNVFGTYPPDDTGSSGLAVAKAATNAGLISGYQHATSLNAALAALMVGPVITGINWYSSFDKPTSSGFVSISPNAYIRGGHEIVVTGVDVVNKRVRAKNSWGSSWGNNGRFEWSWDDWTRLLHEQGDVTTAVPLSQPAPTPTPASTWPIEGQKVSDAQLLQVARAWAKG